MKFIIWIIAALVLFLLYVKYLERKSYYFPSKNIDATPESIGLTYEDVRIETSDNKQIHGWYIPHPEARYTMIFSHGNAGNISHRLDKIFFFHKLKINILIFDYRGYGKSKGSPSEKGLFNDILAAYDYLTQKRSIQNDSILLYGESLGGAVAIECAYKNSAGGLIVEDTFTSVKDMAKIYYPFVPQFLISNLYDSKSKIKHIRCPVLIIHSREDDIAPFAHGEQLFELAPEPKYFCIIHGSHNEAFFNSLDTIKQEIQTFLNELNPPSPSSSPLRGEESSS